jgi:hypothetical protein
MHVDGGVITQVFTYPSNSIAVMKQLTGRVNRRDIHVYAIRNGKVSPEWSATPRRTLSIGSRAISILLQRQGINDLERIYRTARQDGADFNLAFIGSDFEHAPHEEFDAGYMTELFEYAYRLGAKGYPWRKMPPTDGPP